MMIGWSCCRAVNRLQAPWVIKIDGDNAVCRATVAVAELRKVPKLLLCDVFSRPELFLVVTAMHLLQCEGRLLSL